MTRNIGMKHCTLLLLWMSSLLAVDVSIGSSGGISSNASKRLVRRSKQKELEREEGLHNSIEKRINGWPKWEHYFVSLDKLTFVEIGANNGLNKGSVQGDPIYDYATKHHWQGYSIEPNPNSFKELQANYAQMKRVFPLQLAVSDKDGKVDLHMADGPAHNNEGNSILPGSAFSKTLQVPALSIQSLWSQYVTGKFHAVDILVIDVEGAEPKVLQGTFREPKPRFILFEYYHLNHDDHQSIQNTLAEQGYRWVDQDAGDELHELIAKGKGK